ncbi:radical SAM protein [[Eubacterium] cellulosolvens]
MAENRCNRQELNQQKLEKYFGHDKKPYTETNRNASKTPEYRHRIKDYDGSNPLELAEHLREKVCKNSSRKYYRFRGGRFYGGIAAGDCVGCILDCVFCWSYKPRLNPETTGKFYTAKHVAEKLLSIAKKNGYNKVRITGNEPTLCREHLIEVLEYIPKDILFILETNGILLDADYVKALTPFKHHLHVRVSLKGVTENQFIQVTGMAGQFVEYPFKTLGHLTRAGISCNAAIMKELLDQDNIEILVSRLKDIDVGLAQDLEVESLIMYPFIDQELARRNLNKNFKPK